MIFILIVLFRQRVYAETRFIQVYDSFRNEVFMYGIYSQRFILERDFFRNEV